MNVYLHTSYHIEFACSNSGIWRKTGQTGRMYTDYGSGDTGTGTSVLTVLYLV